MARFKNVLNLVNQVKETLSPEQTFLQDLKRSIELDDIKTSRKPSMTYKPSSMNCIRNMYYQRLGVDTSSQGSSYSFVGICNSGSDIHERIQSYVHGMKANGFDCEYVNVATYVKQRGLDSYLEVKEKPDFRKKKWETKLYHKTLFMSFLCDGIIKYQGKYYILELKTEISNKWWKREGVDESHYNQGTAYSIAFGIKDVIFVYINRDTLDMKSYMFTPTDDMKQELVGRITECDDYINRFEVPPIPKDVSKKACSYCNYAAQCRKDG